MSKGDTQKRQEYFEKVHRLFREYKRIFIVNVDNVASTQMHQIRASLRGHATILMGKNTMIRKALREIIAENPKLETIVPYICGNIGLVFTNADLKMVRDKIVANRVQAGAKIGLVAQHDIIIPAGNTGIDPNKTSFFQALGISTKVVKGAIEIMSDVLIVKTGRKVGPSEAALLNMLNLMPFTFGLTVTDVYDDGTIFASSMLDISEEVMTKFMQNAIKNIAALSLKINFPTVASAPHLLVNAYKKIIGTCLVTDYSFPAANKIKETLKNAASFAPPAAAASKTTAAPKATAKPVETEEPEDEEMGLSLFD